jgi:pterin-4a-carbinolamine dehydratase
MTDYITPKQFRESEGVEDWRVVGDGANAFFRTGSFAKGARLVQAISELPGIDDHQPDIDVRHEGVTVRLITFADDYGGMSQRDLVLARGISGVAQVAAACLATYLPHEPRSRRASAVEARRASSCGLVPLSEGERRGVQREKAQEVRVCIALDLALKAEDGHGRIGA